MFAPVVGKELLLNESEAGLDSFSLHHWDKSDRSDRNLAGVSQTGPQKRVYRIVPSAIKTGTGLSKGLVGVAYVGGFAKQAAMMA